MSAARLQLPRVRCLPCTGSAAELRLWPPPPLPPPPSPPPPKRVAVAAAAATVAAAADRVAAAAAASASPDADRRRAQESLKAVGLAQTGEKPDLERRLRQHGEGESLKLDGVNPAALKNPALRKRVQSAACRATSIWVRATTSSTD